MPDGGRRDAVLVHYYRAMVGRADIWRTRMDATTNWAIVATAAVISFSLGNAAVPHYVVAIASLMTVGFLLLEARRLTFYNLWQQRVLEIERGLIRSALVGDLAEEGSEERAAVAALAAQLGRTAPSMPRWKAVARRLRRVYLYLFAVQILVWLFKLASHPAPVSGLDELVARAHVASVAGAAVLATTALLFAAACVLAFAAGGVDRDPS